MSDKKPSGESFLLGAIIGAALGAAAGILFAPAPGEVSRAKLKKKAKEFGRKASDAYEEIEPAIRKAKKEVIDPIVDNVSDMEFVKKAKVKMEEINEDGLVDTVKEDVSNMEKEIADSDLVKKAKKTFFRRS